MFGVQNIQDDKIQSTFLIYSLNKKKALVFFPNEIKLLKVASIYNSL
jgi:hypothetical protein